MRFIGALIFWIVIAIIAFFIFAFSGTYQVGADVPHWRITEKAIELVRENAIEHRTADITVPPLEDPAMIRRGAQAYAKGCTGCHLSPARTQSDFREALYPHPPNLTRFSPNPAEAFWVIKHGLKMTAMPSHHSMPDDTIWAVVAYLQKQPRMGAEEFKALTEPEPVAAPAPATSAPVPASAVSAAASSAR